MLSELSGEQIRFSGRASIGGPVHKAAWSSGAGATRDELCQEGSLGAHQGWKSGGGSDRFASGSFSLPPPLLSIMRSLFTPRARGDRAPRLFPRGRHCFRHWFLPGELMD